MNISVKEMEIKKDNKRIYGKVYRPENDGRYPAVIMSHGYNGTHLDFDKEASFFACRGYVAYAFDFCGGSTRSKSSGLTTEMTLFTEESDLRLVYETIAKLDYVNNAKIYLFGASQGGMVSTMVAEILQEKIAGMVLYYPALCIADNWNERYPRIEDIPETENFWGMELGNVFAKSIHGYKTFENIGTYAGPVKIIYGEKDPIVPYISMVKAKEVYRTLELMVLENEGHGFSRDAGEVALKAAFDFIHGRNISNVFEELPEQYKIPCEKRGEIISFTYQTMNHKNKEDDKIYTKKALVYLPYGYDNTKPHNILYLMHGGSDSPEWFFGGEGEHTELKNIIDHLIAEEIMEPMIICAVSYYTEYLHDATENCGNFYLELIYDVMPAVEANYRTYATEQSKEGLKKSRMHRAFAGFSMGAMTTWSVMEHCMDYFSYYMPISGDCWALGIKQGGEQPEATASYLARKIMTSGYSKKDFYIYAGCGEEDIARPNLIPMIEAMKKQEDIFVYADSFEKGNLYCITCEAGGHDVKTVKRVLYNGLPKMCR